MKPSLKLFPSFFFLLFFSCSQKTNKPLFQLMENTGINFENKVEDNKLENSFLFRNFYNGAGVAIGDINNDGLPDVFLTSNMGENKLYLNKGNLQFEDISAKAGLKQDSMWSTGVTFVDINGDGWLDIYVCNSGHMHTGNRRNKFISITMILPLRNPPQNMDWIFQPIPHRFLFLIMIWMATWIAL